MTESQTAEYLVKGKDVNPDSVRRFAHDVLHIPLEKTENLKPGDLVEHQTKRPPIKVKLTWVSSSVANS